MIDPCPCKGCTDRHTACHDHCEKYQEWSGQHHAEQDDLKTQRSRWYTPRSAARDKADDHNIKHPIKGRKGGNQ